MNKGRIAIKTKFRNSGTCFPMTSVHLIPTAIINNLFLDVPFLHISLVWWTFYFEVWLLKEW